MRRSRCEAKQCGALTRLPRRLCVFARMAGKSSNCVWKMNWFEKKNRLILPLTAVRGQRHFSLVAPPLHKCINFPEELTQITHWWICCIQQCVQMHWVLSMIPIPNRAPQMQTSSARVAQMPRSFRLSDKMQKCSKGKECNETDGT